jgi:hypothetical protein
MAYTATILKQSVHGDERVIHYSVLADAASGSVATGLSVIHQVQTSPQSLTTAIYKVKANRNGADTAALNGTVLISSIASGDVLLMTVYGH